VLRADKFAIFKCWLSENHGSLKLPELSGPVQPVMGQLYMHQYKNLLGDAV
jgi:hypothetical protein